MTKLRAVAIDGPAASGKSSTASAVARALGWVHVDSGSLYRALTWVAVRDNLSDPDDIIAAADAAHVSLTATAGGVTLHVDGVADVETVIRTADIDQRVSVIAAMAPLRDWVNARIRAILPALPGAVIDGRDIGTIVVPDAPLKIFLTASPSARAQRRVVQHGQDTEPGRIEREAAALAERDRRDAARSVAPLRRASDAVLLDTTGMTLAEQVALIVAMAGKVFPGA